MKRMLIFTSIFCLSVLGLGLLSSPAQALDVTAANGSAKAIQAAVDQVAAAGGGNVYIPAGNWNFGNKTQVDVSNKKTGVIIPGGVSVYGAGEGLTTLWENVYGEGGNFFTLDGANGKPSEIAYITFLGNPILPEPVEDSNLFSAGVRVLRANDFRIHHCTFLNFQSHGINVREYDTEHITKGVIDHNVFDAPYKDEVWASNPPNPDDRKTRWCYGVQVNGVGTRWRDINDLLGKYVDGVVVIEDNTFFRMRHAVASNTGGWYVFRHNNVTICPHYGTFAKSGPDVHEGAIEYFGGRGLEGYNNTYLGTEYAQQAYLLRGGSGVLFGDTAGNIGYYAFLSYNEWTNHTPQNSVTDLYIWDNNLINVDTPVQADGYTEGVHYFLSEKLGYTPYPYPHPLTLENITYPVNITGIVTDSSTGLPIQGASVTCNAFSDTTNSTGGYFIKMTTPAPGSCSLTASKTDYTAQSISFSFPGNETYIQDFTLDPTTMSHNIISGRLIDKNNIPIQATIIAYQQDTNIIVNSTQTLNGYYNLAAQPGTYDIQFNLTNFYIPNYYIKIPSVDVSSDVYDLIKSVTGYSVENKVSIVIDIADPQTIQTYSEIKPFRVLQNGTNTTEVSLLSELDSNKWYYENSVKKKLYLIATPWTVPDCGNGECEIGEDYTNCPGDCPLESHLVGYWKFDEGSGTTAVDNSDNNNDGITNGATWTSDCKSGSCLNFDGVDDYIEVTSNAGLETSYVSVSAWIKMNDLAETQTIISKTAASNWALGFHDWSSANCLLGFLNFAVRIGTDYYCAGYTNISLSTGMWYHVAGTYDGSDVKIYVDGELKNTTSAPGTISTNSAPICFGEEASLTACDEGENYNGVIDEVKIYNRSLTADEILAHASA